VPAAEFEVIVGALEQTLDPTASIAADKIFKVPFEEALDLVGRRSVFLRGGVAYVHERDFGEFSVDVSHIDRQLLHF
jgi:hypothetical protein